MPLQRTAASFREEVESVIREAASAIERSQEKLFSLAEEIRQEVMELQRELERLKADVARQVEEVDRLEREDRQVRERLLAMSGRLRQFPEEEVRRVYEEARDVRASLQVAREREKVLRQRRDELERRLRRAEELLDQAEAMIGQVSMAFSLLTGKVKELEGQAREAGKKRQLIYSILRAQEEERRRVSREIHDGPAQILANAVLRLDYCQKLLQENLERGLRELEELKNVIKVSLREVRKIIFDLRPLALEDLGFSGAVRTYLDTFSAQWPVKAELRVEGEERRLPQPLELAGYRLIQEALQNVARHALASRVEVKISYLPTALRLSVEDDGRGFDPQEPPKPGSFGLMGMRERAELLGGRLEVESAPGKGTRVVAYLPYGQEEDFHAA